MPQAWVDELKHSFEGMPFREWSQMSKMLLRGLEGEGVSPVKNGRGLDAYFAAVDQTPLAAASIGQVHLATTYAGERVVVKAIYPEIRRYLIADLKNARKAAQRITWILKLPMKGTINAIMDEEVECFPRMISASRRVEAPSRSRRASPPGEEVVGGFFFDFEAVRTDLTEMLRAGRRRGPRGRAAR